MVHMVRHSFSYVSHRDRKQVAADLKAIYQATTLSETEHRLAEFEKEWSRAYPGATTQDRHEDSDEE
jgi:putative transposase